MTFTVDAVAKGVLSKRIYVYDIMTLFMVLAGISLAKKYKVSAAWLIDKLDLKGTTKGECGISKEHALVFYNFSDQSDSLLSYAREVKKRIKENFDIVLEFEPTIFS